MIIICNFDAATKKAIKQGNIAYLLKQLDGKPICNLLYNLSHYFNGACNFGAHETLKELLKLQTKHSNFDRTRGIIEHYLGGRPHSVLMHLSIKNHHNDCLKTLFEHIQPQIYWGQCTELVTQCIQQALSAKNPSAIKIAMDFEKSCCSTRPEHYSTSDDIALWWPRLENQPKDSAKHIVQHMDKSLVNHLIVWRLHAHSKHKGALTALIETCNPQKVLTLIKNTNLPGLYQIHPQDLIWLDEQFSARQKVALNKAVGKAKTIKTRKTRKI